MGGKQDFSRLMHFRGASWRHCSPSKNERPIEVVADKQYGEILGVNIIGITALEIVGPASLDS
jgi:pyruvate/2-oxoglutarate dehydrogenase complex dihydrolipoamide dehydrogenase (E3) component